MNYKDYKCLKLGDWMSVGKFSDKLYAMEFLTGAVGIPEYHIISKEEYDTFEARKDTDKVMEINRRSAFGLALRDNSCLNFDEDTIINRND
ncbi:hypothetical protein [[Eubacterium] hominis]|uniref:hypothetical protein n=1 Tax=[Eubacterium] hominis TaxID=2764325 RepID=UPI003A4D5CF0